MKRMATAVSGIALIGTLGLSACAQFENSDESKEHETSAVCSFADSTIEELKAGGSLAKSAASVIKDNTEDEQLKKLASQVTDSDAGKKPVKKMKNYLHEKCDE